MRILCTSPGKFGDLLWSLPTARALAETFGAPVDLVVAQGFGSLLPLLRQQPYLGDVWEDASWITRDTAPRTPREPPQDFHDRYRAVFHLGYDGWPQRRLAEQVYTQIARQLSPLAPLDLERPWISAPPAPRRTYLPHLVFAFSEEWIELKVGVISAVFRALEAEEISYSILTPLGPSRWDEWRFRRAGVAKVYTDWIQASVLLAEADLVVGCLSAPWVLANALGKRTLVVEPAKMRWDSPGGWHESIFWRPSAKNRMVLGNDGLPTFDARAVCAAVIEELGPVSPER